MFDQDSEKNGKTGHKHEELPLRSTFELFDANFFSEPKVNLVKCTVTVWEAKVNLVKKNTVTVWDF